MLATGGSLSTAIDECQHAGSGSIISVSIIAAPEGVKKIQQKHPDTTLYIASLDERLNDNNYIIPGLGDAGDRIFNTEA